MKIYILPVHPQFQPQSQPFRYPAHSEDYGVEQDFLLYLQANQELLAPTPESADWHYLPIFWTRWHLNHDFGRTGLHELKQEVDRAIIDDSKTFTICQNDDGPIVDTGKTTLFLASRKSPYGVDIPLLCSPHQVPAIKPAKKYLASFIGNVKTHPIRREMVNHLVHRPDVYIYDGHLGASFFVEKVLESLIALCPRGYGGSSFRFYEVMQLGVVPFLIGDIDTRPFKKFILWDNVSLFTQSVSDVNRILCSLNQHELLTMGNYAAYLWSHLTYQKWCPFVIRELEELK
jgi:hypothetical protein